MRWWRLGKQPHDYQETQEYQYDDLKPIPITHDREI